MAASNNDIEMVNMSTQSRLQTPIEVEESEPLNPDAIVVEIQPETQDDSDGPNNVDNTLLELIESIKVRCVQTWLIFLKTTYQ